MSTISIEVSATDAAGAQAMAMVGGVITTLPPPSTGASWQQVHIGGGGFVTKISMANDGTMVVATDSGGAFISASGTATWKQLITSQSMPSGDVGPGANDAAAFSNGYGAYAVGIAPSDSSRVYLYFNGLVYVSRNGGGTFVRMTGFSSTAADPNDSSGNPSFRLCGPYIAVDPINPDVMYVGTPSGGCFTSTNGSSLSVVSAVGTGSTPGGATQGGGHVIVFDSSGGTSSGKTLNVYISTYGTGVYKSTNSGGSWTLTTGTPTSHTQMACGSDGTVWLVDQTHTLNKYTGTWAASPGGVTTSAVCVAVDPSNAAKVYVYDTVTGHVWSTANTGSSWTDHVAPGHVAVDVPWLAWKYIPNPTFTAIVQFGVNPISGHLYAVNGDGVWWTDVANFTNWNSQTAGIENLTSNWIISPSGNGSKPVFSTWDFGVWYIGNPDVYQSTHGVANEFQPCWSQDYCGDANPTSIVALLNTGGSEHSGISSDGGQTWTFPFPGTWNDAAGGSIAACDPNHIVITPSGLQPSYTLNGGTTWTQISSGALPIVHGFEFSWGQEIAADRVDITTYYAYTGATSSVYKSTDGGITWNIVSTPGFVGTSSFNSRIRCVPGQSGHIFFTEGLTAGPHPFNNLFYRSTNHGANWSAVTGFKEVWSFGFGKAAVGQSYPAVYVCGWYNGVYGIYRSIDNCVTWQFLIDFPMGNFDFCKSLEGDMNIYGTVYVALQGSGFMYGKNL